MEIPARASGSASEERTPVMARGSGPATWRGIHPRSAWISGGTFSSGHTIESSSGVRVTDQSVSFAAHSGSGVCAGNRQMASRSERTRTVSECFIPVVTVCTGSVMCGRVPGASSRRPDLEARVLVHALHMRFVHGEHRTLVRQPAPSMNRPRDAYRSRWSPLRLATASPSKRCPRIACGEGQKIHKIPLRCRSRLNGTVRTK
jgi:hypothetical protein